MLSAACVSLLLVLALSRGTAEEVDPYKDCPKGCDCLDAYVDCSGKMLIGLPETLPLWTKDLDLSSNKIGGSLKFESDSYFQLTTLRLSKNSIMYFPFFLNTTSLTHLNLAHNKIDKLDSIALQNLPDLKNLDMNKNKLKYLDNNTFPISNHLRVLNLNNNLISNLNVDCFDTLTHLVDLKISHNRLFNIPRGIFKNLENLELLDFSRNEISVIEGLIFSELTNLKVLLLRKNIIEDLRAGSFFNLRNVQSLYLEGNSLNKVSKNWLYGLTSLIYLNISYNKIDKIESGWDNCQHLEELDLSHNKLHFIGGKDLEKLEKLQKLYLNNNKLAFIEDGSFKHTPLLNVLILDYNHLAWMIEDKVDPFNGLKNLKTLSLANNKILYIKKEAFYGLDNLEDLNLLENSILEIQEEVLKSMPNLGRLYLNSTSLICDCSLLWVKESTIFDNLPINYINMVCGYPEKNRGKYVDDVSFNDFLCLETSPKPMITFHPESKMVFEGENITLKCGVNSSSTEKINFIWKKDNHDLESISEFHYSSYESNSIVQYSILNFYHISMAQSGQYQCIASNQFGITYSNRSTLSVVVYPYFTKVPRNSTVKIGSSAKLECAANGYPTTQISWQKDGGTEFPAAQEHRMKVSQDDVFLIIDVKLVDMGIYSCTAKNSVGTIATNVTLTILEPPWFGNVMFQKQVNVGDSVSLECLSYGSPKPKVKWIKNGIEITAGNRHFFNIEDQLLVITNTSIDDSGTYQCEISNSQGLKVQEVEVNIIPLNQSFVQKYTVWSTVIVINVCIIISSAIWGCYMYRTKYSSSNLINIADNKSLNSTNSQDSGNGTSTKKSQELYHDSLNVGQELNTNEGDLLPEITLPLIIPGTVVLGENSVQYTHSKTATLPVQLPIEKLGENYGNSTLSCSTTDCKTNGCSSLIPHSNPHECLYVPTEIP